MSSDDRIAIVKVNEAHDECYDLEMFKRIRDEVGITIRHQIIMHDRGYRIVKI